MSAPAVWAHGYVGSRSGPWAPASSWSDVYRAGVDLGASVVFALEVDVPALVDDGLVRLEVSGGDEREPGEVWRVRLEPDPAVGAGRAAVSVVLLERDAGGMAGPWRGLDPRELLRAFEAFARLAGVEWSDSTGRTAERLILSTHPRSRGGTLLDADPFTPEVCRGGALETGWQSWRRPLEPAEQGARFLHAFDANAQYLAAWSAAELGHGRPAHLDGPVTFNPARAGVWRIVNAGALRNVTPLLPAPWLEGRDWFTTPTVLRILEVCDGLEAPEIAEAWVWPARSRFLRGAAERLRDARAVALEELGRAAAAVDSLTGEGAAEWLSRKVTAGAVLEAVKDLYRVETGRLSMARADRSPWARPDWGHTLRAVARCNLHRRLVRLGAAPFAIATDGLLFADDEPDGRVFAARIGLPLGTGLGTFKHDATVPAAAVAELEGARAGALFRAVGDAALEVSA